MRILKSTHLMVAAGLLASAGFVASAGIVTYDLSADFSQTSNPNGVWSYNLNNTPITAQLPGGWGYYPNYDSSITQVSSSSSVYDVQAGDILMHAPSVPYGGPSTYLDIAWTSPANGVISINGSAWAANEWLASFGSSRDANWWLSVGGTEIASRSSMYAVSSTDNTAQFASNLLPGSSLSGISVTAGEVVEFGVAANTYYGYFVGVDEAITLTTVPEPEPTTLVDGAGLLGFVLMKLGARSRRSNAASNIKK